MRNVVRGVGLCVALAGFGVLAVGTGGGGAGRRGAACESDTAVTAVRAAELEAAAKALADREAKILELSAALRRWRSARPMRRRSRWGWWTR